MAVSCSPAPSRRIPATDIADARPFARSIADVLMTFSAYDYAVVGGLTDAGVRVVSPDRYAQVVRVQAQAIADETTKIVASTASAAGPVRDRLVTLADAIGDLRTDALLYADGRDPELLARVFADIERGWTLLRELDALLKDDAALDAAIARGTSFKAVVQASPRFVLTVGPFGSEAEAAAAAPKVGVGAVAATVAPFVVRATFEDRAKADAAAAALGAQRLTGIVTQELAYGFQRGGATPDAELWREPARIIDTTAKSRKIALSDDGGWVVTGSDDGWAVVFDPQNRQTAMPLMPAGMSALGIDDDGKFFVAGGQKLAFFFLPAGPFLGQSVRLNNVISQLIFVPGVVDRGSRAFIAISQGPTGDDAGGPGVIAGRAPDGALLGAPFPISVAGSGAWAGATDDGWLYYASTIDGALEVRTFRVRYDRQPRGVIRVPGRARGFTIDRLGRYAVAITDQGTFRFLPRSADPTKTLTRLGDPVMDAQFAADGTLYLLDKKTITQVSPEGAVSWTSPLLDGRRMVVGRRAVVLDGTEKLVSFVPADGRPDPLAPVGTIQDLTVSRDGSWVGVIADAWRAVLFRLQ